MPNMLYLSIDQVEVLIYLLALYAKKRLKALSPQFNVLSSLNDQQSFSPLLTLEATTLTNCLPTGS